MSMIYLDNHATTCVDPRVLETMLPFFCESYGNAASRGHAFGWRAEEHVEIAREQVAALIGAEPREIIFTSGATESDNLAILGVAKASSAQGDHIVTVSTEHKAVLDTCAHLSDNGLRVTLVPVDSEGLVSTARIEEAITDRTVLVSVMTANNEIGVIAPVRDIGAICRARGVLFHTDAAQAAGRIALDVNAMNVDLMSLSAHKMHGPKGVGALYVRRRRPRVTLAPLLHGGGHERGLRSGTLDVPGIVGFGAAAALAQTLLDSEPSRLRTLRDQLLERLVAGLDDVEVNGSMTHRLVNNLNISIAHVDGEALITDLSRSVAVSSGSACTSATLAPSHVLRALGLPDERAHGSLRFGLSRFTTEAEIERAATRVIESAMRLREMSPMPLPIKKAQGQPAAQAQAEALHANPSQEVPPCPPTMQL